MPSPSPASSPLILIVDDDASSRGLLERMIESLDYRSVSVDSGEEALRVARKCRPDAVLLDMIMPGLDGREVCRRLRHMPETAAVPVLMVTSLGDVDSRIQAFESGADDFITKPFDRRDLSARLRARMELAATREEVAQLHGVLATIRLISHEFNNPLQSVIGGLDLLQIARASGEVDEGEALAMISDGTTRLAELSQRLVHITEPSFKPSPIGQMLDIDASR